MKKIFRYVLMTAVVCSFGSFVISCGNDKNDDADRTTETPPPTPTPTVNTEDYDATNAAQWGNYMVVVANLLKADAQTLYNQWNNGYAALFKNHNSNEYQSAIQCVEQILDGCIDIADEVGNAKIGEPYNLYMDNQVVAALYAVESWYSWHSREDYRNNIYSIRNAFYGTRNGSKAENSLYTLLGQHNPELQQKADRLINGSANAIMDIPQPFRNHINSAESVEAMTVCAALSQFIEEELKPYFQEHLNDNATLDPIVQQYVDAVVLPTYKDLAEKNIALSKAVNDFKAAPSNNGFVACANAWLDARTPWEQSEAFLFGPVSELGLDPNMDSWPLDQAQIAEILKSQNFVNLEWNGDYEELDENGNGTEQAKKISTAQSLRGFHTLEYLIFKDGQARTVK